jgi:hypothetical protein
MRAVELARLNEEPCRYLFREYGEDDDARNLVLQSPICELRPQDGRFLPQMVTVKFADGTKRWFNPDDQIEIRSE